MNKPTKYGAEPTTIDGIRFDSKLEARRWQYLRLLERAGEINGLTVHPCFELQPAFVLTGKTFRAVKYEADFEYIDLVRERRHIVEDCKGAITAEAKLKLKLMAYVHHIIVDIVHAQDF